MVALLLALAHASVPPPDYDEALAKVEWYALNQQIEAACPPTQSRAATVCARSDDLKRIIARAEKWEATVMEDAGIAYLAGLAHRYTGNTSAAKSQWERATRLDPDYRAPWYDVGELYLASGNLQLAQEAFTRVLVLTEDPQQVWIGHWRLAEVAGAKGDKEAFEKHLREALRNGFDPRMVTGLPNWKAIYQDARMRPSMESLFTVYGGRDVLDSLSTP